MRVIAYLGEQFYFNNDCFCAKPTSAAFLQDTFGKDSVFICSQVITSSDLSSSWSTSVSKDNFIPYPEYTSTKEFIIKYIFSSTFRKDFVGKTDEVIKMYSGNIFWIRAPSIGSILFGLRVLQSGEKLINHICANAAKTWMSPKYSVIEKAFGYLTSKVLMSMLSYICKNPNTTNLCTGSELQAFSEKYSPARTFQFVDVMLEKPAIPLRKADLATPAKLLFVGRVVEDKGVFDLLYVVKKLQGRASLNIVGGGPDLERARTLATQLGVNEYVNFTGQVPHHTLPSYFNVSDLVVVPSNNNYEGFPRVIMEAWGHHRPVVVSEVGGIRAFVQDRKNALIVAPGDLGQLYDAIDLLLSDGDLYKRLCEGARQASSISYKQYWIDFLRKHMNLE